jgi:hypothetical protein
VKILFPRVIVTIPILESIGKPNLEVFPMNWTEKVDTARAAHYLAPFMDGRNPTHFLADNQAGRTSVSVIPYERIGNKIYYRMRHLEAFAWCLARGLGSAVVTTRLHIEDADDLPTIQVTRGADPAVEIGLHPEPYRSDRIGEGFGRGRQRYETECPADLTLA